MNGLNVLIDSLLYELPLTVVISFLTFIELP